MCQKEREWGWQYKTKLWREAEIGKVQSRIQEMKNALEQDQSCRVRIGSKAYRWKMHIHFLNRQECLNDKNVLNRVECLKSYKIIAVLFTLNLFPLVQYWWRSAKSLCTVPFTCRVTEALGWWQIPWSGCPKEACCRSPRQFCTLRYLELVTLR